MIKNESNLETIKRDTINMVKEEYGSFVTYVMKNKNVEGDLESFISDVFDITLLGMRFGETKYRKENNYTGKMNVFLPRTVIDLVNGIITNIAGTF